MKNSRPYWISFRKSSSTTSAYLKFSFESGTTSEPLGDPVPAELKEERLQQLASLQESISLARNQTYVGKTQPVLIEGHADGISIGRAPHDAPEIDGMVLIEGDAPLGEIVPVQITGAMIHDLSGRSAHEIIVSEYRALCAHMR